MSSDNHLTNVDATILGAGIAGLSVADELIGRGLKVAIIDKKLPGSGASGAPLVLANPATGRRAKMTWKADLCYQHLKNVLESVQQETEQPFFTENGVLRPALTKEMAEDFERSPEKYDWPDNWIEWIPEKEFKNKYPFFGDNYGGLHIRKAFSIDPIPFLRSYSDTLVKKGLQTIYNSSVHINSDSKQLKVISSDQEAEFKSEIVIYAVGSAITDMNEWNFLDFSSIKGQTISLDLEEELPFRESISSLGYMAADPVKRNRLVIGSTYEHHFDHVKPDQNGKKALLSKLERTLPGLKSAIKSTDQWAGVRIAMNDHQPVIGRHPEKENLFIISGLGSKGMIQSRYLAKLLSDQIIENQEPPEEVSISRFS